MTVALDYTPSFYIADGQTKEFQYNFSLTMTSNLVVFTMDKRGEKTIVDKDLYDFKINPDNTGGAVTFNKAPESGTNVLIARIETPTQEKDWRNTEGFNLKSLTDEFDKLTRWCQELAENNKRSIVVPENKKDDPLDLYNRMIISDELESVKFLKNENGNLYYSLDGENWTMLPKSAMIQELRQRTVLDEHQVPHTVFEYRIGEKWYNVLSGVSHTGLLDRDAEDSHPISAITGLQDKLSEKLNTESAEKTYATKTELSSHTENTDNPHSVTKAQVGLGNVDNTSDLSKPISTATQNALNGKLSIKQNPQDAGKVVKVGSDGNLEFSSESSGGGLQSVSHGATLKGAGTDLLPLDVADGSIGNTQLAEEVKQEIAGKQPAGNYATEEELAQGLAGKADKATTLAGYGITDGATKTELNTKLSTVATDGETITGNGTTADPLKGAKKGTVVDWGMPDYSATIGIASLPYIAPTNGYIVGWWSGNGNIARIDGIGIGATPANSFGSVQVLISKNSVFSVADGASQINFRFCPLKGVSNA